MFSIFDQHNTKGPIEFDASLVISFEDILKSLISNPRGHTKKLRHSYQMNMLGFLIRYITLCFIMLYSYIFLEDVVSLFSWI